MNTSFSLLKNCDNRMSLYLEDFIRMELIKFKKNAIMSCDQLQKSSINNLIFVNRVFEELVCI